LNPLLTCCSHIMALLCIAFYFISEHLYLWYL
jgi:hypothetical protein